MTTVDRTSEAGDARGESLPDYAPVPESALGPALNEQGYYVGRVERNLYWVTDGTYQSGVPDHLGRGGAAGCAAARSRGRVHREHDLLG